LLLLLRNENDVPQELPKSPCSHRDSNALNDLNP
jgi:hypothetical protein